MRPSVGRSNPAIMRRQVVLPEPDGPSIVKNSPRRISRSTPSTAVTSPNVLRTPARRMSACAFVPAATSRAVVSVAISVFYRFWPTRREQLVRSYAALAKRRLPLRPIQRAGLRRPGLRLVRADDDDHVRAAALRERLLVGRLGLRDVKPVPHESRLASRARLEQHDRLVHLALERVVLVADLEALLLELGADLAREAVDGGAVEDRDRDVLRLDRRSPRLRGLLLRRAAGGGSGLLGARRRARVVVRELGDAEGDAAADHEHADEGDDDVTRFGKPTRRAAIPRVAAVLRARGASEDRGLAASVHSRDRRGGARGRGGGGGWGGGGA